MLEPLMLHGSPEQTVAHASVGLFGDVHASTAQDIRSSSISEYASHSQRLSLAVSAVEHPVQVLKGGS